ncbi:MAG: internal scaffolding protein [Microviridae sp.]|nr:MAG: internal scaffolding protein [Microviridae sp.]
MTNTRYSVPRAAYNYNAEAASDRSAIREWDPSRARQSDAHDADINNIVRRFGLTGQLPQGIRAPTFSDFSECVLDYQTALNAIKEAETSFLALPATVRERFSHDPQKLVEFCSDEANAAEMRSLGLAVGPSETPTDGDPDPGKAS